MSMELGGLQSLETIIQIGNHKKVGSSKSFSILIKQLEQTIFEESISLLTVFLLVSFIPTLLIVFLVTAALWIHTTFIYLDSGSKTSWTFVQIELWLTGTSVSVSYTHLTLPTKRIV